VRWFVHVKRKSNGDWVKKCNQLVIEGKAGRGRGRKMWLECVRRDMTELGLRLDDTEVIPIGKILVLQPAWWKRLSR